MDKSHTILAHLYLPSKNFEVYEMREGIKKIVIGVNIFLPFAIVDVYTRIKIRTIHEIGHLKVPWLHPHAMHLQVTVAPGGCPDLLLRHQS